MSTVASRTFRSTPHRDAAADLELRSSTCLTQGETVAARNELLAVAGIAASVIADQAPKGAPIVVTCDGPRTRIYCLYDDDAIEGSDANERRPGLRSAQGRLARLAALPADDLAWVQAALKKQHPHHRAGPDAACPSDESAETRRRPQTLVLDPKGFLGP